MLKYILMVKGTVGIVQTNYNSVANIMHIWEWFIAGHTKQSITKQYQARHSITGATLIDYVSGYYVQNGAKLNAAKILVVFLLLLGYLQQT